MQPVEEGQIQISLTLENFQAAAGIRAIIVKQTAANDALSYLRHVNSLLGPQQSGLDKAF